MNRVVGSAMLIAALLVAGRAAAQTQIKPRVLLMVDTSGSMKNELDSNINTGADGSRSYRDGVLERSQTATPGYAYGVGFATGGAMCGAAVTQFEGSQSRMFAAKAAVANVINGAGDVDWGLMRYSGTQCPINPTISGSNDCQAGTQNGCASGRACNNYGGNVNICACVSDDECRPSQFCMDISPFTGGGADFRCVYDNNFCAANVYGMSDGRRHGNNGSYACTNATRLPTTFGGSCGTVANCKKIQTCTTSNGGNNSTCASGNGSQCDDGSCICGSGGNNCPAGFTCSAGLCRSNATTECSSCRVEQVCTATTDCSAGASCTNLGVGPVKACTCNPGTCPTGYTCDASTTPNRCIYDLGCSSAGGFITVDPVTPGASTQVLPWVDNIEDYTGPTGSTTAMANPELRAVGATPLAGAARSAATWYANIRSAASDSKISCRPYVLVQLTDGEDTCEAGRDSIAENNSGPIAAAAKFVRETIPGARVPNKVYVIGLSISSTDTQTELNAIAKAGGTSKARFATSQVEIEAALSDIVSSSVLVEKCNNADDDCDDLCDESFPDVAVTNPACPNRVAKTCTNGQLPGTKCFAQGRFICSADLLSQACDAATCLGDSTKCPTSETCNGQDDDCDGIVDNCGGGGPGSCCPACTPSGEICDGKDNDCDGVVDNLLTDTGLACGADIGQCTPGVTACCRESNASPGNCTLDSAPNNANNHIVCLGGKAGSSEVCDNIDNDCDGQTDEVQMQCFPSTPAFPGAMPGKGLCTFGQQKCPHASCGSAGNPACNPLPPGNAGCPVDWPAGKPCPRPEAFGSCQNFNGPVAEICDTIDNDCNGTADDNLSGFGGGCCPSGLDCTNSTSPGPPPVTGTRCKNGVLVCRMGQSVCDNAVGRAPEICNGIDDDCDGIVDDVPGIGSPCSGPGIMTGGECRAAFGCLGTTTGSGPNGLTCAQAVGPKPELCNAKDDDCNGMVDDNIMTANDPRVGVVGQPAWASKFPMGADTNGDGVVDVSEMDPLSGSPCARLPDDPVSMMPVSMLPCMPGTTICVDQASAGGGFVGTIQCDGFVGPEPNRCDGVPRDCTGRTDNATCPDGFSCDNGSCVLECGGGEFPCPGGLTCQESTKLCIPDACQTLSCPSGQTCRIDEMGMASCFDPCSNVTCPDSYRCRSGVCYEENCRNFGCPDGEICQGTPPLCVVNKCAGVTCPDGQFCSDGQCLLACTTSCPGGQVCSNGQCVADPCASKICAAGQACRITGGVAECVTDQCGTGCGIGQTCCGGQCITDPCVGTVCPPAASLCVTDAVCNPTCVGPEVPPANQVVGAGGGGFACDVSGGRGTGTRSSLILGLCLGLLAFLRRRDAGRSL